MQSPTTLYKDDPEQTRFAEWREVWYAEDFNSGWILCEQHGWWDNKEQCAYFRVPTLGEPFKSESDASTAFDARIKKLGEDGWIHKFTDHWLLVGSNCSK